MSAINGNVNVRQGDSKARVSNLRYSLPNYDHLIHGSCSHPLSIMLTDLWNEQVVSTSLSLTLIGWPVSSNNVLMEDTKTFALHPIA